MSNAELIAEARSVVSWHMADEITGPNDDLLTRLADALEKLEAENEENASDCIHYSQLSEKLYNALHSVAPHAAKAILAEHA